MIKAIGVISSLAMCTVALSSAAAADAGWQPEQIDGWPVITQRTSGTSYQVTSGVDYSSEDVQTVSGRQPVEEISTDLENPNVKIGVVGADDEVVNPSDETISSMADRTGAVAGINGGFFQINASGEPTDGEVIDGEIYKSPKNNNNAAFVVDSKGNVSYDAVTFSGTITDGSATHSLTSVNWESDSTGDSITEVTPRLGKVDSRYLGGTRLLVEGTSTDKGATIKVTSITTTDHLDKLPTGTYALLSSDSPSAGGSWIRSNVNVGDTVSLSTKLNGASGDVQQLVEGSYRIIADGKANTDSKGNSDGGDTDDPRVAVGTTSDGHLVMVTMDGHQTTDKAVGVTMSQLTSYLLSKGVTNAVQLDCGGSAQMVARESGDTTVTVQNTPSDGSERPVINGIFLYSTAPTNGRTQAVHVNSGKTVSAAAGSTVSVPVYATDSAGNTTTRDKASVTVSPSSLGTWSSGKFTAKKAGKGTITAKMGDAVSSVAVDVTQKFDSLSVTPTDLDVTNSGSGTLAVTGKVNGVSESIDDSSVTWKVSDSSLGSITSDGVFTGAASGSGLVTVTATVGSQTVSTQVAVGTAHETAAVADTAADWSASYHNATGDSAFTEDASDVPAGQSASVGISYDMPGKSGVHQLVMYPKKTITVDKNGEGVSPTSITVWMKIDDTVHSKFEVCISFVQNNGQKTNEYVSGLSYGVWTPVTVDVPSGASLPLTLNFVDLLSINPTAESAGTVHLGYVTGDYSPRPASTYTYSGIASNPSWLTFKESSSDFSAGGTTYLMGDDAHLLANDTGSASAINLENIAKRVKGESYVTSSGQTVEPLSSVATPTLVQMLGDMSDNGNLDNLQYAKSLIANVGLPYHDLVGNHEDTQGTLSEAVNFASVFGDTHYSYRSGQSTFIAVDNSHGGVTSSDSYQSPTVASGQYSWLVNQLDQASTKTVIVGIHMPAYDPFPAKNSQFSDRWEARQFLQIVQNYQNAHPGVHVMIVYGHARGFSEQILDPEGETVTWPSGIPQFTFADLGMPAYSTASQGGFYHFGLVHVNDDGTVEFSVEPLLSKLTIDQGSSDSTSLTSTMAKSVTSTAVSATAKTDTLQAGSTKQYSATGVCQQGDNGNPAVNLPIADPVSHVWSTSDKSVATIDSTSGLLTARKAGTVTVSVTTGGITATTTLTVTASSASNGASNQGDASDGVPDGQAENSGTTSSVTTSTAGAGSGSGSGSKASNSGRTSSAAGSAKSAKSAKSAGSHSTMRTLYGVLGRTGASVAAVVLAAASAAVAGLVVVVVRRRMPR